MLQELVPLCSSHPPGDTTSLCVQSKCGPNNVCEHHILIVLTRHELTLITAPLTSSASTQTSTGSLVVQAWQSRRCSSCLCMCYLEQVLCLEATKAATMRLCACRNLICRLFYWDTRNPNKSASEVRPREAQASQASNASFSKGS